MLNERNTIGDYTSRLEMIERGKYHLTCTCGLSRWCHLRAPDAKLERKEHDASHKVETHT